LRVATVREPTDPALGRLAQELGASDPWASGMMFTLDRLLAHPALAAARRTYDVVLSDRSLFSTLAYQGSALPPTASRRLRRLQRGVTDPPQRIVFLAVPPEIALRRVGGRGKKRAPLERRRTLARVDQAYRSMARGRGWVTVDATRPMGAVADDVDAALALWLPQRTGRRGPGR
jgi:thymidylate kinase